MRASESASVRKAMRSVEGRRSAHREMRGRAHAGTGGRLHSERGVAEGIISPSSPFNTGEGNAAIRGLAVDSAMNKLPA